MTPRVAIAAAFAFNGALYGAWAARIPAIKETHDLSPSMLGILLLVLSFGAILAFPISGRLSDRFGAVRVTRWTALGYLPSTLAMALAPNVALLAVALFLMGAILGGMDVAMNTWATELEKRQKVQAMSFFHAMWSLGTAMGAGFGALAILWGWSVPLHFLVFGGVVAAIALSMLRVEWTSDTHTSGKATVFALPKGVLLFVGIAVFCSSVGEGAMADWAALLLIELGVDEARAATGFFVFSLAMVFVRLIGDRVIARLGAVMVARLSGAAGAVGVIIAVFGGSYATALVGFTIIAIGVAMMFPISMSRAAQEPGMSPGNAIASVATFAYGGTLLGPPIIGFVAQATSVSGAFLMVAGLMVLMIGLAGSYAHPNT